MAAKVADNAPEDIAIAKSLTDADNVPTKLRCAICDKVAFNAYKLPCCDQNICGDCQLSLPQSCPICQHSPLNGEDAKPLKSLRLTVAQYLKSVKKKREKQQHAATSENATPAAPTPAAASGGALPEDVVVAEPIPASLVNATLEPSEQGVEQEEEEGLPVAHDDFRYRDDPKLELDPTADPETGAARIAEEQSELEAIEATFGKTESSKHGDENDADGEDSDDESDASDVVIFTGDEDKTAINPWGEGEEEEYEEEQWGQHGQHGGLGQGGFGFPNGQGDFAGFNGNMSNMTPEMLQMMMQQMNNLQNGNWANMMGMSGMGMGMNPMDMSSMFNFGMQGMGGMNANMMNMMNGGMGMDFNGSFSGGWNDQQMGGNFGASGYYPDGGYNQSSHQGNYPHMSHQHQQHFSKNNSYNQRGGSFRGQRGSGRGYHNQGYHNRNHSQTIPGASDGPPPNAPTGPKAQRENFDGQQASSSTRNRANSNAGSERQQAAEGTASDTNKQQVSPDTISKESFGASEQRDEQTGQSNSFTASEGKHEPANGDVDMSYGDDANGPEGSYYQQSHRGSFRGRGGLEIRNGRGRGGSNWQYQGIRGSDSQPPTPVEAPGVGVEGAPSGPKAMREPHSWGSRGRGGLHVGGRPHSQSVSSAKPDETSERRHRSRSRSPDRDPGYSRTSSHRHSRHHRSRSPEESEDTRRREKKRKRSRKYDHDLSDSEILKGQARDSHYDQEADSKERRSRRDRERHHSSKDHRESSRERRKHRRRSRTPDDYEAKHGESVETNGYEQERRLAEEQRKERKYEEARSRDRSREKERHRDRDRDREHEKRKSSKRDRSASPDRPSSRREKERDKYRDREVEEEPESRRPSATSIPKSSKVHTPSVQKQLEQGFRIHGRSKEKERDRLKAASEAVQPASPPPIEVQEPAQNMLPPTGPRADRSSGTPVKFKLDLGLGIKGSSGRTSNSASRRGSQPVTPTASAPPKPVAPADPYAEERERAAKARLDKHKAKRRESSDAPTTGVESLSRKRSWVDEGDGQAAAAEHTGRLGKKTRKMNYKYEDEFEVGRREEERESARYR